MSNGRTIGEVAHGELDVDEMLARIFAAGDGGPRRRSAEVGSA